MAVGHYIERDVSGAPSNGTWAVIAIAVVLISLALLVSNFSRRVEPQQNIPISDEGYQGSGQINIQ